ncbi:MAG TPA: cyclodeaminase/cyclohydrolase family protein [Candidatus Limnocylindrales bacterium]|jgi:formiminotetrahydrofolate cyclodeaminase
MPDVPADASFRDLTLRAFVDELASAAPVPGGGSASAIAASLGAGLVAMVASLSQDRPRYAQHTSLHDRSRDVGERLATRFFDLADEDAAAYAAFAAARKLPRTTDDEIAARQRALATAARRAAEVPLETVEACLELIVTAEALVGRCNVNATSDLEVATLLGDAAARGAAANVLINLPSVDDEAFAAAATARVEEILTRIREVVAEVHSGVRNPREREPVPIAPR